MKNITWVFTIGILSGFSQNSFARFELEFKRDVALEASYPGVVYYHSGDQVLDFGLSEGPSNSMWLTRINTPEGVTHGYNFCSSNKIKILPTQLVCAPMDSYQKGIGLELTGVFKTAEEEKDYTRVIGGCSDCQEFDYSKQCWWVNQSKTVGYFHGKVKIQTFEMNQARLFDAKNREVAISVGSASGTREWKSVEQETLISKHKEWLGWQCIPSVSCTSFCWGDQ